MTLEPYIVLVLAGSCLEGTGSSLQKLGISGGAEGKGRRGVFNPVWWLGVFVMILGAGLAIQGLADGEVTVAVPLATLSMLVAFVLGVFALGERISSREWIPVSGLALGAAALVFSAAPPPSAELATLGLMRAFGVCVAVVSLLVGLGWARRDSPGAEILLPVGAGLLMGFGNALTKFAAEEVRAVTGSFQLSNWSDLTVLASTPSAYAAVGSILVSFAIVQLAFSRGRVSIIAPVRLTIQIATAVGLGAVVFGEGIPPWRAFGIAIVSLSATALVFAKRNEAPSAGSGSLGGEAQLG